MKFLRSLGVLTIIVELSAPTHASAHARQSVRDEAPRFAHPARGRQSSGYVKPGVGLLAAGFPRGVAAGDGRPTDGRTGGADEGSKRRRESDAGPQKDARPTGPLAEPLPSRDGLINGVYLDAFSILMEDNACSRFFGGPDAALKVLTELSRRLRMTKLNPGVGIRMYGPSTIFIFRNNLTYRLFERAEVNTVGPFNQQRILTSNEPAPIVGSFPAYTREARVLMILHELGHLIEGPNRDWLLPNDGNDKAQGDKNTSLIEAKCGAQIRELKKKHKTGAVFTDAAPTATPGSIGQRPAPGVVERGDDLPDRSSNRRYVISRSARTTSADSTEVL